jgi:hypothetical protein
LRCTLHPLTQLAQKLLVKLLTLHLLQRHVTVPLKEKKGKEKQHCTDGPRHDNSMLHFEWGLQKPLSPGCQVVK